MEACNLTIRRENAPHFAEAFVDSKATEARRSLNKRGVRNIHRYEGEEFTNIAYERAAVYENAWVVVSLVVEEIDDRTATVVLLVGGGGEGPFKLEEISVRRILHGEESVGQAGRFVTVLQDVEGICESLDLAVETEWESETESNTAQKITRKIFDS